MGLTLDKVHHYVKQPGTNDVRLIQTNPYLRFGVEGHPVVFLQGGRFFYENGVEIDEIERWLAGAIEDANPKALKECGYMEDLGFEEGTDEEPLEELADGELPPTAATKRTVTSRSVPQRDTPGSDEPPRRAVKASTRPVAAKPPAGKAPVRRVPPRRGA